MLMLLGKLEPKHNPRKLVQSSVRLRCIFPFALAKKKKAKSQAWVCARCRISLLDVLTLSAHRRVNSVDYRCTSLLSSLALRPCVLRSQPFFQHEHYFLWEPRTRARERKSDGPQEPYSTPAQHREWTFFSRSRLTTYCVIELPSDLSRV